MTATIPIGFAAAGGRDVPVVDLGLKIRSIPARLQEWALIDTGSHETVFPEALLRARGFRMEAAKRSAHGLHGLGGAQASRLLVDAVIVVRDESGVFHPANLPHVHVVRNDMPPILGRDVLEALDATLVIDFHQKTGHLEVG